MSKKTTILAGLAATLGSVVIAGSVFASSSAQTSFHVLFNALLAGDIEVDVEGARASSTR